MQAVRNGTSWSGHERNRCLLNFSGQQFIDASSLSGLDFGDDGRGLAVTDWNRDGKLDLWLRNRSAPRLRLMINQAAKGEFLSLRLQGVTCNSDAIGAIVEVDCGGLPLVRSLRAGEFFLSQSSKWLHFGLENENVIQKVTVHWPGGEAEEFKGLASGSRYLLRQGSGTAKKIEQPQEVKISSAATPLTESNQSTQHVRLPVAVSLPKLSYRTPLAKDQQLRATGKHQLLVIWESSCELCDRDLRLLESQKSDLGKAGVSTLALAADHLESMEQVYQRIDKTSFSGEWGLCTPSSLRALWKWQNAWFERKSPPTVPFAILIDGKGNGLSLYRGRIDVNTVLKDSRELIGINPRERWHLAPPLKGTWFTNPLSKAYIQNAIFNEMNQLDP